MTRVFNTKGRTVWAAGMTVVLAVLLFFHPVLTQRGHFWDDFINYYGPIFNWIARSLAAGRLPLWIDEMSGGHPNVLQSAHWLYPPCMILGLLAKLGSISGAVIELMIVAHVVVFGMGMYSYLRRMEIRPWVAAIGALASCLSGHVVAWLTSPTIILGIAWLPWTLWGIERFLKGEGKRYLCWAGIFGGAQLLAGHNQWTLYSFLFLGIYMISRGAAHSLPDVAATFWRRWARVGLAAGVVFLIAGLVGAARLLPDLEYLTRAYRSAEQTEQLFANPEFARPWWSTANYILPHAWGRVEGSRQHFSYWGRAGYSHVTGFWYAWEEANYVGVIPLGLTLAAVVYLRRDRRVWVLAGLAAAGLAFGYGVENPLRNLLADLLPFLKKTRYHSRLPSLWLSVCLPALAALALETALRVPRSVWAIRLRSRQGKRQMVLWFILPLATGVLLYLVLRNCFSQPEAQAAFVGDIWVFVVVWLALWGAVGAWASGRLRETPACLLLFLLIWADLYHATGRLHTFPHSLEEVHRPNQVEEILVRLRDQAGLGGQFRSAWNGHQANARSVYLGIDSWNGYLVNPLDRWVRLQHQAEQTQSLAKAYDLMNVRFDINEAAVSGRLRDRSDTMLPRVFSVHLVARSNYPEVLQRVLSAEFDGRTMAYVEEALPAVEALSDGEWDHLEVLAYDPMRRLVRVTMGAPGLLVFSENYYPGWKAWVSGQRQAVRVVNGVLSGVAVPAGEHLVELRYAPASMYGGLAITLVTMLGIGLWELLRRHQ